MVYERWSIGYLGKWWLLASPGELGGDNELLQVFEQKRYCDVCSMLRNRDPGMDVGSYPHGGNLTSICGHRSRSLYYLSDGWRARNP